VSENDDDPLAIEANLKRVMLEKKHSRDSMYLAGPWDLYQYDRPVVSSL
jgi:hypothetical protein